MEGILGVGIPEIIIVLLALFIVGGPQNMRKWAYQVGRGMRQLRQAWVEMMRQMEKEMGPEGKEVMEQMMTTAEEVGQGLRELRSISPTRNIVGGAARLVSPTEAPAKPDPQTPPSEPVSSADEAKKYPAWLPPDQSQPS